MPNSIDMANGWANDTAFDDAKMREVADDIRYAITEAERELMDKGKRTIIERAVDLVDSNSWLSATFLDARLIKPFSCPVSTEKKARASSGAFTALIFLVSSILRGFGQVVFQDNPWTGVFVCVAGGLPHWPTAVMGAITTIFPLLLQPSETRGLVASGLYGFNGVLLGWGYSTFDNTIQKADTCNREVKEVWYGSLVVGSGLIALLRAFPALLFLGMLTGILHVVISRSFTRSTKIPPLTWPYNIALLMWMACATLSTNYDTLFTNATTPRAVAGDYTVAWFLEAWLRGVSQVVFSPNLWSGVVLLIGILSGSPYCVLLTVYGALIGLLTGMGIGLDFRSMLDSGLVCYNPVLVALSLGGFYIAPSIKGFAIMTFGCILSVIAFQGVVNFLVLPNGGPALTAPFCITVTILLGAMSWDFIDGIPVLFPRQLSCTERHWALKSKTRRAIRAVLEMEGGSMVESLPSTDIIRELGHTVFKKVTDQLPIANTPDECDYLHRLLSQAGLHHWHHYASAAGCGDRSGCSIAKVAAVLEYSAKYEVLRTVFLRCCEFGSETGILGSEAAVGRFPAGLKDQAVLSARRVCGPGEASQIGVIFGDRDFDNKPLEGIITDCATMAVQDSI